MELRGRPIKSNRVDSYCNYCGRTIESNKINPDRSTVICSICYYNYLKNQKKNKPSKYFSSEHEWWSKNKHLMIDYNENPIPDLDYIKSKIAKYLKDTGDNNDI